MSEENGWVKLPIDVEWDSLPPGTRLRGDVKEHVYELMAEGPLVVTEPPVARGRKYPRGSLSWAEDAFLPAGYRFAGGKAVRAADDLGDTPEHLRPLLKAAREKVPGTVITDDGDDWPVLFAPRAGTHGTILSQGSSCWPRLELRKSIEQGRCYPTEDARRIGREEFGMSFPGDAKHVPATSPKCDTCGVPVTGQKYIAEVQTDNYLVRMPHITCSAKCCDALVARYTEPETKPQAKAGDNGKVMMPSVTFSGLLDARATDEVGAILRDELHKVLGGEHGVTRHMPREQVMEGIYGKPACTCGATSNLAKVGVTVANGRVSQAWRCGPCEQSRRRAELQAAKVEQLKGEMERKVTPKWCETPRGWPEQFSGSSWEE